MCGIVGFIGKPKDHKVCFDLTTALLARTESRGDDASGYWATDSRKKNDNDNAILFSKEPKRSTEFVKSDMWDEWKNRSINLLISHCRKSTVKGSENRNINNHPFRSSDWRTALVHNGNVPEFDALKPSYDVQSQCDSEILLRMMERGGQYNNTFLKEWLSDLKDDDGNLISDLPKDKLPIWLPKLAGLMDIFARINYGAMAVAIGEKWIDGTRALWLFRDKDRPLYVIDMRKTLNQVYIASDKKIWRDSVENTPSCRRFVKPNTSIIEFPEHSIWLLTLNPKGDLGVRKWNITRKRMLNTTFEEERPSLLPVSDTIQMPVIVTNLSHENYEVTNDKPSQQAVNGKPKKHKNRKQKKDSKKKNRGTSPTTHATDSSVTRQTRTGIQDVVGDSRRISDDKDDPYADMTQEQKIGARRVFEKHRDKIKKANKGRNGRYKIRPLLDLLNADKIDLDDEETKIRANYIKDYAKATSKTPKRPPPPPISSNGQVNGESEDYHPFNPMCRIPKENSMSQSNPTVDQAEIDKFYEVVESIRKHLNEVEISMKHLIQTDCVRSQEVLDAISQLTDIESDMAATQLTVDGIQITA